MKKKAEGEHGYYGYPWKDLNTELEIIIIIFNNEKCLEAIEAELIYLYRKTIIDARISK